MSRIITAVVAIFSLSGCSGAQGLIPCTVEAGIVEALSVGVDSVDAQFSGVDSQELDDALEITRGAVNSGRGFVGMCQDRRDGEAWESWVQHGLQAAGGLFQVVQQVLRTSGAIAGDGGNDELVRALGLLQAENRRLSQDE